MRLATRAQRASNNVQTTVLGRCALNSVNAATLIGKLDNVPKSTQTFHRDFNYFSHPKTGECLKRGEKIELSTMKSNESEITSTTVKATADPFMKNVTAKVATTTEHNPYANYSGEYGKNFDHYVKMGVNESDVQESIDKIVEIEYKKESENFQPEVIDNIDSYIILDVENGLEPLKHPQYVTDHHVIHHHEESVAMVTVGCLVLGMLVFLLAMVYIRRITRRVPASRDIEIDGDMQKPYKLEPSRIVHEPLPSKKFDSIIN